MSGILEKYIAFTFDDGPNNTVTPLVQQILEKYDGHGTFFLVGSNITDETAGVIKRGLANGHEMSSHSLTHSDMTKMQPQEIIDEIVETDRRAADAGAALRFFRPPYIAYDQTMFDLIAKPFVCGRGVDDWDKSVTVKQRVDGLLEKAEDGGIILLHDQADNFSTVEALEAVLPKLHAEGWRFVTLSRLFEIKKVEPLTDRPIIYTNVLQRENYYQ